MTEMNWQPIESCPKDTPVLLYLRGGARLGLLRADGFFYKTSWSYGTTGVVDGLPTHYLRLEPPSARPALVETEWETPCPKRDDKQHCNCWYDGEACCACGAAAVECTCIHGAFTKVQHVTTSREDCPVHGVVLAGRPVSAVSPQPEKDR